jgi:hypothetical protein
MDLNKYQMISITPSNFLSNLNATIVTERESMVAYLNGLLPSSIHLQARDITKAAIHCNSLIGSIEAKYFYILAELKTGNC